MGEVIVGIHGKLTKDGAKDIDLLEKWIAGSEVVSILKQFQLQPCIRDESEGRLYPNSQPGSVTIL